MTLFAITRDAFFSVSAYDNGSGRADEGRDMHARNRLGRTRQCAPLMQPNAFRKRPYTLLFDCSFASHVQYALSACQRHAIY